MCVWNNIFQNWILASTMCPRYWVHVVRSGSVFPCRAISTPHTKCLSVLQGGVQDPREADFVWRSQPQWCMREKHVTNKQYPGFSLTCHIWCRNRELTKGRCPEYGSSSSSNGWVNSGTDKKLGEQWQSSQQGEIPAQQGPAGLKEDLHCDLSRSLGRKVSLHQPVR